MADARATVSIGTEAYAVRAEARHHVVLSDEPGELGGKDTGPGPYELLLMSLGSCKIITAKMYADRKGWALTAARVELAHDRPNGRTGPERITTRFVFEGELTDEQRVRLLEIAEKCPVQKTITGGLVVESSQG